MENLTITQARKMLDEGEITSVALTEHYLKRIEEKNEELNAYLEVFDDALEQAKHADEMIAQGNVQPMTGIPLAIKDNILIKGTRTSGASKILENYIASYDATVIVKLKEQGAVFLGHTNMDEFAMGSSTENSAFGVTKNPLDVTRVPGGSSGGSAAAVAADLCVAALGTDTGGSIRQPASFCGIVGFKSTYGGVSRYGAIAMGSSLDQIGPLTKTVEDAHILFEAIRGEDANDSTTLPANHFAKEDKPKAIGVPRDFLAEGVDADVLEVFERSLKNLQDQGYEVKDITLPSAKYALATYYIVMPAEVSTNLARLDGVRYGVKVEGSDLIDDYRQSRGKGFGPETRRRVLIGTFVLSSGYADAYYRKATAVRTLIREELNEAFKDVDVIATPSTTGPAFRIGEKASDPLEMYVQDIFTVPANMAGIPGISVPMGTVDRDGKQLPVGLQFLAAHGNDSTLFSISGTL